MSHYVKFVNARHKYAYFCKSEVISTVMEQVYTQTLMNDALMRDGTPVREYAIEHNMEIYSQNPLEQEKINKQLYDTWFNDWRELTAHAQRILGQIK